MKLGLWKTRPLAASALYATLVEAARDPAWYRARGAADTLDGRFAMLATLVALAIVRLEDGGDEALAVALTERFVDDMDGTMRELGFGDPSIGKQVGTMVGALAGRIAAWRRAIAQEEAWDAVAARSALRGQPVAAEKLEAMAEALRHFHQRLTAANDSALAGGAIQ